MLDQFCAALLFADGEAANTFRRFGQLGNHRRLWSNMLSAARTLVAGGVVESSMIFPSVETAALDK